MDGVRDGVDVGIADGVSDGTKVGVSVGNLLGVAVGDIVEGHISHCAGQALDTDNMLHAFVNTAINSMHTMSSGSPLQTKSLVAVDEALVVVVDVMTCSH